VIEDQDVISDALETMTKDIEVVTSYHLVRKGRGAIPQFKKKFTDFWRRWLIKMSSKGILAQDDGWCLELLKAWLVTMSTSSLRAFRHTGCFVSLVVITWICGDVKKMNGEIETVVKQIGVEEKKDGSARAITLGVKLQGVKEKKHLMEEYMSDMYNRYAYKSLMISVFVHRYRDSEPLIRKDCVAELGAWIKALPETYLDPQYLRYVGWLLSDKIASVRLESVKCLVKLYSNEGMIQGLSQFSERFKTRILEMAEAEVNPGIQLQAVNVGICMSKAGLLEDEDQDQLLSLIFNENEQVRAIVVTHFLEIFEEEVDGRLEEFEGVVNEEWIRFKVLAELITKYSVDEAVRNRIDRAVYKDSQSQNNAGSQNGSMVSQEEERIPSSLMKLHQEALIMRGVTGSTSGFCEYFHGAEGEKGIGYDRIHRVVALIFKESKVLKVFVWGLYV
jgi:cohesin complex subunit SA-1/2